ncbi:MAG: hypothetical protein HQL70_00075 [Magnetococcales bacterium]|nr:hypothetical protein [Magnetococcales bacterium]
MGRLEPEDNFFLVLTVDRDRNTGFDACRHDK